MARRGLLIIGSSYGTLKSPVSWIRGSLNTVLSAAPSAAHQCRDEEDRGERGVGYVEHKRRDREEFPLV